MLTSDGRTVLVLALVAAGAGRLLGVPQLLALGATLGVLLLLLAIAVHLRRLRVQVDRSVRPSRVHVGDESTMELVVTNLGRRRTGPLRLHDRVPGTRGATMVIGGLGPGRSGSATYRLPSARRGVLPVGPLDVTVSDPFGFVEVSTQAAQQDQLVVLPAVVELDAPPGGADDHAPERAATSRLAPSGSDLHSLRPYEVGDDLRRVHWRSTARHGDLLVRVHEQSLSSRTTVLLDARTGSHAAGSFEAAVSTAASVLLAAHARGDAMRLVLAGRREIPPFVQGAAELDGLLGQLTLLTADPDVPLAVTARGLAADRSGGALVLISSAAALAAEPDATAELGASLGTVVVVRLDGGGPAPRGVDVLVDLGPDRGLQAAWNQAVSRGARR